MSPAQQQLLFASGSLLSVSQAAKLTPYSAEYLSLLTRKGKLPAVKVSRDWLTTKQAVRDYVKKQKTKHSKLMDAFDKIEGRAQ
jgi:excisionase family DNA binding protein